MRYIALLPLLVGSAFAQPMPQIGGSADKMAVMGKLTGEWRGTAVVYSQMGEQRLTQTERVGPMLQGDILVVEGRGYDETGQTAFNAFATMSYNVVSQSYEIHSHAMGFSGTYPLTPTDEGFEWEIPAGPGAKIQYEAVVDGESWVETGYYVREGMEPMMTIRMELTRIGNTDWPGAGAVPTN